MPIELTHWRTLTEAVNNTQRPPAFVTDTVFKKTRQNLTDTIDFDIISGTRTLAPFTGKQSPGTVLDKLGYTTSTFKLPRIRVKKGFSAYELLAERVPGNNVYIAGGSLDTFKNQKINLEQTEMLDRITRRIEWMACEALAGAISYTGSEIGFTMSFGMDNNHKPTLTTTGKWDNLSSNVSTANPVTDIRTWSRLIQEDTGFAPDIAIAGSTAIEALLNNTNYQTFQKTESGIQLGSMQLDQQNLRGVINGIKVYEYNGVYDNGSSIVPLIPATAFILISTQAKMVLECGPVFDLAAGTVAARYFSKQWEDFDPSLVWMLVETSCAPIVYQPNAIVYATVC